MACAPRRDRTSGTWCRHHNHMFIEKFGIDKLFLHAFSLEFEHPFTQEKMYFEVEVPAFWNEILKF